MGRGDDWSSPHRASREELRRRARQPGRPGRIGWRIAGGLAVLALVAAAVAARWEVAYYAITPGTALDVGQLISVPRGAAHTHRGSVVLTDVQLVQLTALGYLYYRYDKNAQIVSAADLTGGSSSSAYDEEGIIEMATARQAATLVGLRELGYHPRAVPAGVAVFALQPGASGASTIPVGDVITVAGSARAVALRSLVVAVGATPPGRSILLRFHRFGSKRLYRRSVVVDELKSSGQPATFTCVPLGSSRGGRIVRRAGRVASCLPFYPEQLYRDVNLPFPVAINADGIVGSSAGLSFTLGLIDKLDRGDLTGGLRVAATGTMSNGGSVGVIGGVAQKTIAVRAAGATVFLVPPQNAATARAAAGGKLRVIAVASIGQAVAALERLGGKLVPATSGR
jgi:PDZ domain-containing protein